jgi:hypothetical protein
VTGRFISSNGRTRVDVIRLTTTSKGVTRERSVYRIIKDGIFVADARDINELERFVDLRRTQLTEEVPDDDSS